MNAHKHLEILPGVVANVSPNVTQEVIEALQQLAIKVMENENRT